MTRHNIHIYSSQKSELDILVQEDEVLHGIVSTDQLVVDADGHATEDQQLKAKAVGKRSLLRHVNAGKALPLHNDSRFRRDREGVILQRNYDSKPYSRHTPRSVKRVWESVISVRRELQKHGSDQKQLRRDTKALHVTGVIYAITTAASKRVYVGQTIHSALHRFQQHWALARRGEQTPLHAHLRACGNIRKVYVIPLEIIPEQQYSNRNAAKRARLFRDVATVREKYWIERLHTYKPRGFNVEWSGRKRHRQRSRPMKYRRGAKEQQRQMDQYNLTAADSEVQVAEVQEDQSVPLNDVFPEKDISQQIANGFRRQKGHVRLSERDPEEKKHLNENPYQYSSHRQFGYRNWKRRCNFLVTLYQTDPSALNKIDWSRYLSRNLWLMVNFFEHDPHGWNEKDVATIVAILKGYLLTRHTMAKRQAKEQRPTIFLEWTSQLLRAFSLRKLFESEASKEVFPGDLSLIRNLSVIRKLTEELGRTVFNYSSTARATQNMVPLPNNSACGCRTRFDCRFRLYDGCVCTGNLDIIESQSLRELLHMGAKIRVRTSADAMDAVKSALESFIRRLSATSEMDKEVFTGWKQAIVNGCHTQLNGRLVRETKWNSIGMTEEDRKYLRFIQHHFVLVPVDKAANNIAVICKQHYRSVLAAELSSSSVYETATESAEEVISRHKSYLGNTFKLKNLPDRLAYLYWTPKLHKVPMSQRFIAAAFACTTTDLSKILSDCLHSILRALRDKDDASIRVTSVRRFFVVEGYEEVAAFLQRWPRKQSRVNRVQTGDFSTMYTTIPHKDLITRMERVLDETWDWIAKDHQVDQSAANDQWQFHIALTWRSDEGGSCYWEVSKDRQLLFDHTTRRHRFTLRELKSAVAWLIENTFLVNGGVVKRQVVGVPMGTNCAPPLVNLYLYSYEGEYIDRLVSTAHTAEAQSFHMTFRLIDDVLSVDNPHFDDAIRRSYEEGGLYPAALVLNDTTISESEVNFLGMSIRNIGPHQLCIDVFDKRREFNFLVCRYPQRRSLIPISIAYGVFMGLLHRYYRICTQFSGFCENAALLARTLVSQGWRSSRLRSVFYGFLSTRMVMKWRLSLKFCCSEFARLLLGGVHHAGTPAGR